MVRFVFSFVYTAAPEDMEDTEMKSKKKSSKKKKKSKAASKAKASASAAKPEADAVVGLGVGRSGARPHRLRGLRGRHHDRVP